MRPLQKIISLLLLVCCFETTSLAQQIYVSTKGKDDNPGSRAQPFLSIERAAAHAVSLTGEVVIHIEKGTYYLDKTIQFTSAQFKPRTLTIQGSGEVIISAGRLLKLNWKHFEKGIYVASINDDIPFERLYCNNVLQVLARYPNYDSSAKVFNGTAADAIDAQRIKKWGNPAGGYLHALHGGEWGGFHYRFIGADTAGRLPMEGGWQNNRPSKLHKEMRFIENVFEELDAPGEWFLDKSKKLLYFYPPENINLATSKIEVAHLTKSFVMAGTILQPLRSITFSNLHFKHNERTFMETKEPLLRSDWTFYRGGALLFDGAENCAISDCVFEGLGGNAIVFSNYNKNNLVTGCHIYNIGANALSFIGDMKAVRSPSFSYGSHVPYAEMDKTPGPIGKNYPQQCVVDNNLLHDLGQIEKQATGVQIEVSSQIKVSRNSIYNLPRAGINIGDGCFGGHLIEYNDVFNTVLETGDHGSFNSWGRDRFWAAKRSYMDSLVALHPELILLDAQETTVIRNNRWRCDHGWDVDLDDGSSNYYIYNNLFLNGGLKFREGFFRKAENNIMINNSFHPHVWFKNSGDVFTRNIVMRSYAPIGMNYWGATIDRNFFPDQAALDKARLNGTDQNSLAGDPLFIDPAKGNFNVRPNSPALKTGFKNFDMSSFGVQKPSLKAIALQPAIPLLQTTAAISSSDKPIDFSGGVIKSVEGLGDRSAYGLPDESGVVIISTGKGLLHQSGLQPKDVIVMADGKKIKYVKDFLDIYNALKNFSTSISLTIIRNQQQLTINLTTQ